MTEPRPEPRPEPRRAGRRGWPALVVCVLLAIGLAVVTPDPDTTGRRRYIDAPVGRPARSTDLTVTVTGVELATAVREDDQDPVRTGARFVLVGLRADVRTTGRQFGDAITLQTADGSRYASRDEFISQSLLPTEPGFTRTGTEVFEVPPDRVAGARLVIDPDGAAFDFYAVALRFDLGLTGATTVRTDPVPLADSVVEVTG